MGNIVAGIGEILWDMLPEGKKLGGAPANFACHVARFGFESCVISAVGHDRPGDEIRECLRDKGLGSLIATVPYPTGTVEIELDAEGVPHYSIREGVAWDNIPYSDELARLASDTKAVCFGSLAQRSPVTRATVNRFLDAMPDTDGVLKVFDVNLRQDFYTREILCSSLKKCNVLKINDEELSVISGLFGFRSMDAEGACRLLMQEYGLRMLILTCGANGSYVFVPDEVSFIMTPEVDVVDTVGAGDSFTAAFVSAILKGMPVRSAHRLAVDVSAYVCSQPGAMPVLPEALVSATV